MISIRYTNHFAKLAKALRKKYASLPSDLKALEAQLQENPSLGVDLGGGLRKIRMAILSKGKGKSARARIITYYQQDSDVFMLAIYDKSDTETIPKQELEELLKEILE